MFKSRAALGFPVLIILFFSFYISRAHAVAELPRQLNSGDRNVVSEVLGFGSMTKILSNPYPLGGYSGFEVGLSSEFIPMADIAGLGSKTSQKGDYNYSTLSIGKGMFYNVDLFMQFTPMQQKEGLSSFGGQMRWGFYEAALFPFSLSLILNGGGANFSNLIQVNSFGADLVGVVNMKDVALYFGAGRGRATATFIGGANGITDDQQTHRADVVSSHALFGVHIKIEKFFLAMEVDRYTESTYSGKLGLRF